MCRYRQYNYQCSHVITEPEPYLPCDPNDFCDPKTTTDRPIVISKQGSCGAKDCPMYNGQAATSPNANGGGTSWEMTSSNTNVNGLGEEGGAGAKFRHTVSMKMKTNSFSKVARSLTNKKKKQPEEQYHNGFEQHS